MGIENQLSLIFYYMNVDSYWNLKIKKVKTVRW